MVKVSCFFSKLVFYLLVLQLVNIDAEAILAQHRADLEKAVEHAFQQERSRNLSQMQALKAWAEQAKKELNEEKWRIFPYLEEICELKLVAGIHAKWRY